MGVSNVALVLEKWKKVLLCLLWEGDSDLRLIFWFKDQVIFYVCYSSVKWFLRRLRELWLMF